MLAVDQIVNLLARCEEKAGRLKHIRQGLQGKGSWLPRVWELLVLDAALAVGPVAYEQGERGTARLDLFWQTPVGSLWLEAAFRLTPTEWRHWSSHPVARIFEEKLDQISRAKVAHPIVLVIGTDRVFSLSSGSSTERPHVQRIVRELFRTSNEIAAVVLVPILLETALFIGFDRSAKPVVVVNDNAKPGLDEAAERWLWRLDFGRWPYETWTQAAAHDVHSDLAEVIRNFTGKDIQPPRLPAELCPWTDAPLPTPAWAYHWHFVPLRIVGRDGHYMLCERNKVMAQGRSPEQLARSNLYVMGPRLGYGPAGIQEIPVDGVPQDLFGWTLELP